MKLKAVYNRSLACALLVAFASFTFAQDTIRVPLSVEVPAVQPYDDSVIKSRLDAIETRLSALENKPTPEPGPEPTPDPDPVPEPQPEPEPEPDPLPDPDPAVAIQLPNGETWAGITAPPATPSVKTHHPRLVLDIDKLDELRAKLADPVYARDVEFTRTSNDATDKAFCYAVWGDEVRGREAIQMMLDNNVKRWGGIDGHAYVYQRALIYDWTYNLATPDQRLAMQEILEGFLAKNYPASDDSYYHTTIWKNFPGFNLVVALALDTPEAKQLVADAYSTSEGNFRIYGGGALDVLTSLALDSGGGWQNGPLDRTLTGYEGNMLVGAELIFAAWASATGEDVWNKTTYFAQMPYYLASCSVPFLGAPHEPGRFMLEFWTGLGDSESAALSKWLLDTGYRSTTPARPIRLILGDMRVVGKSPAELGLPLTKHFAGANCYVSRSSWDEAESSEFLFFAREWDLARYEQSTGVIALRHKGKQILSIGALHKKLAIHEFASGVWSWTPDSIDDSDDRNATYWNGNRLTSAIGAASNPIYRPKKLRILSPDSVKARYEDEFAVPGVTFAERQCDIDWPSKTITIKDRLSVGPENRVAICLRLVEEPEINGNTITVPGATITFDTPFSNLYWDGGIDNEVTVPWDEPGVVHNHPYSGYGDDEWRRSVYGLGFLFVEPAIVDGQIDSQFTIKVD